jgi:HK97 family phage portal protein
VSVFGELLRKNTIPLDSAGLARLFASWSESKSGAVVNVDTTLRVAAAFACGRVLAEGIAQIPLKLYREEKSGKKNVATDHPVHWILSRRPNDWMTSFEWREAGMFHAIFARGAVSYINRGLSGKEVIELLPLVPGSWTVRQGADREIFYDVQDVAGGLVGSFPRSSIFRVRGPSWNTVDALSLVNQARDALGLAIAIEEGQARMFANGARPGGILSTDKTLTTEARSRLKALADEGLAGLLNTGRIPVLDDGLKFIAAAMTGVDAQTLESRKHQVEEIARMFRVFPQMIGYADKTSTYASAEQFFIAHVVHSLGPWIERWEQAITRDLLTEKELREGYFAKFSVQALLRGDAAARAAYYKASLGTASSPGWNSPNDVRRLEDQDPDENPAADRIVTVADLSQKPVDPQSPDGPTAPLDAGSTAIDGATAVQDTALNGAQVASLLQIVQAVAAGQLPADTARAMIRASFPGVDDATIEAMLAGLEDFEPAKPDPEPAPEPKPEPAK